MITGKFKNQDIPLKNEDGWRVHVEHRYHDGSFDQFYLSYTPPEVPPEHRLIKQDIYPERLRGMVYKHRRNARLHRDDET